MAQPEDDAFRQLAFLLRVRPELQQICAFGAQWASPHDPEPRGWAPFHIVTKGACLLDVGAQVGMELRAGDVAVLPHGGKHATRAHPDAVGASVPLTVERRVNDHLVIKRNVEGEPDTKLICGRLLFEHAHNNLVLAALPAVVILRSDESRDAQRTREIVEILKSELDEDKVAAAAVAAGLANSLMMIVLRAHFERECQVNGVLALLQGRQTARALAAIVRDLGRSWTLDEMASEANASRATLVRLFRKTAGAAPLAFLSELRLNIARHRILATHEPIALISEEVGYQSEAAFSRAYRRRFGVPPGADRTAPSRTQAQARPEARG